MARVLIVGGGPAGLVLALILARYRVGSVILDPRPAPAPAERSGAFAWPAPGLDLLDWLDLAEGFAQGGSWRQAHELWAGGRPRLVLPLSAGPATRPVLDLPQGQAEALLEAAALGTGRVELRRGHRVTALAAWKGEAAVEVRAADGAGYVETADWAVACDGRSSPVRDWLGIAADAVDLGTDTLVADLDTAGDEPARVSRLMLDCVRPHAFIPFARQRLRFLSRVSAGERTAFAVAPERATALLRALRPELGLKRLLWARTLRPHERHSRSFRKDRWLLAGDAAQALDWSAGGGVPSGMLGVWRLGWRLALAARGHPRGSALLDDYDRDQRATSAWLRRRYRLPFADLALRSRAATGLLAGLLGLAGRVPALAGHLTGGAFEAGPLETAGAADRPYDGPWRMPGRLGPWCCGARLPPLASTALPSASAELGRRHLILPVGGFDPDQEASLARAVHDRLGVPGTRLDAPAEAPWRVRHGPPALALIRPDWQVVALYSV